MTEQEAEVMDSRGYSVVKANSIIQKSRYKLSIAEQKTISPKNSLLRLKNLLRRNMKESSFSLYTLLTYESIVRYVDLITEAEKITVM